MVDSASTSKGSRHGIVGLIDMHVYIGVKFLCDLERNFDMPAAIGRRILVEWHAADDVDAKIHHLSHQSLSAGRFYDSLLRKGDDLDIDQIAKPFSGADQAFGR